MFEPIEDLVKEQDRRCALQLELEEDEEGGITLEPTLE